MNAKPATVREKLWLWAHPEASYNGPQWGLPRDSRVTPMEASLWMGIPNVILIHYGDRPQPPISQYAIPLQSASRLMWSVVGGGGRTNETMQESVLALVDGMPNLVGMFMDDFFHYRGNPSLQWLAETDVSFPVDVVIDLSESVEASGVELRQSQAPGGDHRTAAVTIEGMEADGEWRLIGTGMVPNEAGAHLGISFAAQRIKSLRVRIESSHDVGGSRSCGLTSLSITEKGSPLDLDEARLTVSSRIGHRELSIEERMAIFDGRAGENWADLGLTSPRVIIDRVPAVPASLTISQLKDLRRGVKEVGDDLEIGVAIYDYQLSAPGVIQYLDLVDLVTLWHWQPKDLAELSTNLSRLRSLVPGKRLMVGCYMWNFQAGEPMDLDAMKQQCDLGLQWLEQGDIDGMIFLASNLCDLEIEAVEWTRDWVRANGDRPLVAS